MSQDELSTCVCIFDSATLMSSCVSALYPPSPSCPLETVFSHENCFMLLILLIQYIRNVPAARHDHRDVVKYLMRRITEVMEEQERVQGEQSQPAQGAAGRSASASAAQHASGTTQAQKSSKAAVAGAARDTSQASTSTAGAPQARSSSQAGNTQAAAGSSSSHGHSSSSGSKECTVCGATSGASGKALMRCSRCYGSARYCSQECQRKDWPAHKVACTPAAAAHKQDAA